MINRAQNTSKVTEIQAKVDSLVVSMGYESALRIKHNAFFALFSATYTGEVLERSVERCLRRSVERLRKRENRS